MDFECCGLDVPLPPPSLIVTHDPQLYLFWYLCWKIFGWKSAFLSQSRDCLWSSRLAIRLFEQGLIHCSESILSWSSMESHKCPLSRWVSQPYFEADAKNEAVATAGSPNILSVFQIWLKGLFKDESGCWIGSRNLGARPRITDESQLVKNRNQHPVLVKPVILLVQFLSPVKWSLQCFYINSRRHILDRHSGVTLLLTKVLPKITLILLSFEPVLLCLQGYRARKGFRT
jgi:hypothetical protein